MLVAAVEPATLLHAFVGRKIDTAMGATHRRRGLGGWHSSVLSGSFGTPGGAQYKEENQTDDDGEN